MEWIRKEIGEITPYQIPKLLDVEVKLNQNESPFNIPEDLIEKIKDRIGTTPFNRYNEGSSKKLRELLSSKFNVSSEQVIVGAGIDEILYYITLAFVNKGDKIVRPVPSFSMYEICAKISGARDVPIGLDEKFELSEEFVEQSKDAKIVFLCRPNNPTSNSFSKKTIKRIIKSCKGIVCIDEAYVEFAEQDCREFLKYENVILLRTFSKLYSAAAIRLGYGISSEKIIETLNKVKLPWNVSLITQIIGGLLLENEKRFEKNIQEIKKSRESLIKGLNKLGIKTIPSDANFVLFETKNPNKVFKALLQCRVLIRNVSSYPKLGKYLRVSIGTEKETALFLEALKKAVTPVDAIIFDIDGVLIDVSKSYREAIKQTVKAIYDRTVSDSDIAKIKQLPNSNNDWDVTYSLAYEIKDLKCIDRTAKAYAQVKEKYQELYFGGLRDFETPIAKIKTLESLVVRGYCLGIVTSRPRQEALYALDRLFPEIFNPRYVIALEDCVVEKPDPRPLILAKKRMGCRNALYVGDTINDSMAAKAAGMQFVSVKRGLDAEFVIRNVNYIQEVLK